MNAAIALQAGETLLRQKQVRELTGLANSTIYLYISQGRFPRPIRIGTRAVAYTRSSINRWMQEKIDAAAKESSQLSPAEVTMETAGPDSTTTEAKPWASFASPRQTRSAR
jgi:prophage regulatory protein